jgi:hypothetical protein
MRKAGVRYTLGVGLEQYGIYTGTQEVIGIFYGDRPIPANPEEDVPKIVQQMKTGTANPEYWLVYWEDTISRRHGTRYPPSLIGEPPLEFNEAEQERFKAYWDRAAAYCKEVRKEMPEAKISLGGYPNFLEEFLRRGFPKEYLDAVSLHQAPYWYLSERPPEIETINGLYFVEQWKKMYGYEDLPTIMIEANFHGTAPGYLTERDQADLYVRDFLIGLAYRVRLFGMSGMIVDVANDYLRSKWGCTALCRNAPEMNPKESFVSYATMTSVLDRAKYLGYVNTGSNTAYALRFRAKDGQNIYVLWTVRGQRDATLKLSADAPVAVIDCMHNQTNLQSAGQAVKVAIGESPVYVKTAADVTAVGLGDPLYSAQPPRDAVLLDSLSNLSNWNPQTGRDQFLEQVNPKYPRRPGNFTYSIVDDPQHGSLLQVTPLQAEGGALLPMYGILERTEAQPIPGQPRKLGLWVKGDSGWGRVIFEVTDANGERWTGVGGLEDRYSNGFFNFDGWRWIEIDLPGYYDNEFPQPSDPDWTPRGRTRIVAYPLSLSKIIIELRTKMVYVTDLVDVPDPSVRISDVMAVY